MKIIAFILALKEKPYYPLISLMRQTIKPSKIVIVAAYPSACVDYFKGVRIECLVIRPDTSLSVGERVGIALTIAFKLFLTEDYDYMLKLDSDIYFDERFIEENIKAGYDLMGRGAGMIIKVKKFLEIFDHKWPISPLDDATVVELFRVRGYKVLPWKWVYPAKLVRKPKYDASRAFKIGYEFYRLGFPLLYEILTIHYRILQREPIFIFHLIGYLAALFCGEKKYPFSIDIKKYYDTILINSIKLKLINLTTKLSRSLSSFFNALLSLRH